MTDDDPELCRMLIRYDSMRFRHTCKYCMKHKRICPACAGVA